MTRKIPSPKPVVEYKGCRIHTFQQFVGAWMVQFRGPNGISGQTAGFTERAAVAKAKAEILHFARYERLCNTPGYWNKVHRRADTSNRVQAWKRRAERALSVAP